MPRFNLIQYLETDLQNGVLQVLVSTDTGYQLGRLRTLMAQCDAIGYRFNITVTLLPNKQRNAEKLSKQITKVITRHQNTNDRLVKINQDALELIRQKDEAIKSLKEELAKKGEKTS